MYDKFGNGAGFGSASANVDEWEDCDEIYILRGGVWLRVKYGNVLEIFMLDRRYHSDPGMTPGNDWAGGSAYGTAAKDSGTADGTRIPFDAGANEPSVGETLSEDGGDASGVLVYTDVTSGTWGNNDAAGYFYIHTSDGTWTDDEQIDGSTTADIANVNGTEDTTPGFKLIQSGQNFTSTLNEGDIVTDTDNDEYAHIVSVDSNIMLTLNNDIIAEGEAFSVGESGGSKYDTAAEAHAAGHVQRQAFETYLGASTSLAKMMASEMIFTHNEAGGGDVLADCDGVSFGSKTNICDSLAPVMYKLMLQVDDASDFAAADYIVGGTSGAVGKIESISSDIITFKTNYTGRCFDTGAISITFYSGGTAEPVDGELMTGNSSGATGRLMDWVVSSGSWAGGDASGTF